MARRPKKLQPHEVFDLVWQELAKLGRCDSYLGAEYFRVRQEYGKFTSEYGRLCFDGKLYDEMVVAAFITWRANIGPDGPTEEV